MIEINMQMHVKCRSCGDYLNCRQDGEYLEVEPCAVCLSEAEDDGYEEGFTEGEAS